jgi:hypothetical protein
MANGTLGQYGRTVLMLMGGELDRSLKAGIWAILLSMAALVVVTAITLAFIISGRCLQNSKCANLRVEDFSYIVLVGCQCCRSYSYLGQSTFRIRLARFAQAVNKVRKFIIIRVHSMGKNWWEKCQITS